MGLDVTCIEVVFVLVFLDKTCVGDNGCLDNFEGARGHCFEDCVLNERGRSENADPFVVEVATDGGLEGLKGVGACICCSNDAGCGLHLLGLGCYASTGIKSNDLGLIAHPEESCYFVGRLEDFSAVVFEVMKDGDFYLIVGKEDEVMDLAEVFHLAVHGGIVSHCF
jgi:hypothetical protein